MTSEYDRQSRRDKAAAKRRLAACEAHAVLTRAMIDDCHRSRQPDPPADPKGAPTPMPTTDPTRPLIPLFTATGWSGTTPDPRPPVPPDGDWTQAMREAGWVVDALDWTGEYASNLELSVSWHPAHGYLCSLWLSDRAEAVLCPDLPGLLAFLSLALPLIEVSSRLDDRWEQSRREAARRDSA